MRGVHGVTSTSPTTQVLDVSEQHYKIVVADGKVRRDLQGDMHRDRRNDQTRTRPGGRPRPLCAAIRSPMSAAAQPPTRGDCRDSGSPSVSQLLRLFPPPAFGERRHRRLTGCRVAVRRVEVPVIAIGECPEPWRASRRGDSFHDAPNRCTLSEYVIVIVAPVALWAARGGTLKDKLIAAAHRHLFLPQILFRPAFVQKRSGGRITQRVKIEME